MMNGPTCWSGCASGRMSGMSAPVHFVPSQCRYRRVESQGFPAGSAEARLYMIRRFAGQDTPQFGYTPRPVGSDVSRRAVRLPAGDHMPQYSQLPHEVEPSSRSCANAESCAPAGTSTLVGSVGPVRPTGARPDYSRRRSAEAGTWGCWSDPGRFSIGSGTGPPAFRYISRSLTNSRAKISESALPSPGGSAAFSFHWLTRLVLVNEPVSSAKQVLGSRNTSVWICLGSTSFSGPKFFQNSRSEERRVGEDG